MSDTAMIESIARDLADAGTDITLAADRIAADPAAAIARSIDAWADALDAINRAGVLIGKALKSDQRAAEAITAALRARAVAQWEASNG